MNTVIQGEILSPKDDAAPNTGPLAPPVRYGARADVAALLKECFSSLLRKPPGINAIFIALALALPAAIAIASSSILKAEKNLLDSRHVTVFLSNINTNTAAQFAETLAANQHISAATLLPIDLQTREVLTIDIQPAATLGEAQLAAIVSELNSHTSVEYVAVNPAWLERNVEALKNTRMLRLASLAVASLFTVALVALLAASDLKRQKAELEVLRQMGATRSMALKPLKLRCGLLTVVAGISGTLLAWGIIKNVPFVVDTTTIEQILPQPLPVAGMISLIILAALSSFLAVEILGKKI